ncbi:hypothetical protein U1Q18_019234 [Sarracenia purpurea var. burkii]
MDFSKVPLAKRTRLQRVLFYREYKEMKKRKMAESEGCGVSREVNDSESVEGSGGRRTMSGKVESNRLNENAKEDVSNVGYVGFRSGEIRGIKRVRKSENGLETENAKMKNVLPIHGDRKSIRKDIKLIEKVNNGLNRNMNVIRIGVVDDDDDDDNDGSDHEAANSVKEGVDSKKNKQSGKRLKKNKNIVDQMRVDDDDCEDEVEFLGMKYENGKKIEFDDCIIDSSCSSLDRKEKKVICDVSADSENLEESSESEDVSESGPINATESLNSSDSSDFGDSESSSGENNDSSSDEDYEFDNSSSSSVHSYDSNSSNGKEKEGNVKGNGKRRVDGDGKKRSVEEGRLKRLCGLDIWIDREEEDDQEGSGGPKSIAERLRFRKRFSQSEKRRKKKQEFGTFSCPLTLTDEELDDDSSGDEDEIDCDEKKQEFGTFSCPLTLTDEELDDYSSGDEDETDCDEKNCFGNGINGKYVQKLGEEGRRKVVMAAKRSRNGLDSAAPISVDKVFGV